MAESAFAVARARFDTSPHAGAAAEEGGADGQPLVGILERLYILSTRARSKPREEAP